MNYDLAERIHASPQFRDLMSKRNRYAITMTVLMMMVYFGYILLVAFNKPLLATKVAAGATMSVGIPLGLGVLVFTIVLTAIYVHRANSEFDRMKDALLREAAR